MSVMVVTAIAAIVMVAVIIVVAAGQLIPDLRGNFNRIHSKFPTVTHPDGKRFYRNSADKWMPL